MNPTPSSPSSEYLTYPGDHRFRLPSQKMGAGNEADVYRVGKGAVVKMPHVLTDKWAQKAKWAVDHREAFYHPSSRWAAWPQRLVLDPVSLQTVGVVLPLLEAQPLSAAINPTLREHYFPDWNGATLLSVTINLLSAFNQLHRRGVVHGDGSATNVMVNAAGQVGLIDCDGGQFISDGVPLTCGVTTADYCPPELQPKTPAELDTYVRTPAQDRFSAVVLAIEVLNAGGAHPYSGKWDKADGSRPLATEKRIEQNAWHGARVGPCVGRVSQPSKSLAIGVYGTGIEDLARSTLDDGWEAPERRPLLDRWITELVAVQRSLRVCAVNARHWYRRQCGRCPYCEIKGRTGVDLFPPPQRNVLRLKTNSGWATP